METTTALETTGFLGEGECLGFGLSTSFTDTHTPHPTAYAGLHLSSHTHPQPHSLSWPLRLCPKPSLGMPPPQEGCTICASSISSPTIPSLCLCTDGLTFLGMKATGKKEGLLKRRGQVGPSHLIREEKGASEVQWKGLGWDRGPCLLRCIG